MPSVTLTYAELAALRAQGIELRSDRNAWRMQIERLAGPAPAARQPWWRRLADKESAEAQP